VKLALAHFAGTFTGTAMPARSASRWKRLLGRF
jgi:hypothetical protein